MSWQHPGSDCHKVTAGFRSNVFEVDTISAIMVPRSVGGGGCLKILCNRLNMQKINNLL